MFGGCRDKVVGLRHLWSGPDGAGIMSSSLWIKGGTWGAGCSAQWAEDALPGEKVLTEGTRASAQEMQKRERLQGPVHLERKVLNIYHLISLRGCLWSQTAWIKSHLHCLFAV